LAAKKAGGDVLVFLESGIKQISIETLRELTAQALRKEIGAVGAKVLYSNSVIHHSGVIVGMNGLVGFPHQGMPQEAPGNFLRIQVAHNLSAVSGGCLAIRKEVFEELGGLDTEDFEGGFFDIDLCLRARAKGYRIVWTPYAELTKDDDCATEKSLKNADLKERAAIKQKWKSVIECDPYYNPNFSKEGEPFNIKL
jgi:GT2 family glycosyltransferase